MNSIVSKKIVLPLSVFLILAVVGLLVLVGLPSFSPLLDPLKAAIHRRMAREPLQISQIVVNHKNPNIVYASSHFYGMWKSTDGGNRWTLSINGLGTTDVYSMAIHPENPDIIYAATTGGGIYQSVNGGSFWEDVSEGLTDTHVEDLAFDPTDPNIMYAATLREVFKSVDGGGSWKPAFDENRKVGEEYYVHNLLVLRTSSSEKAILFVGTPDGGFRREEGASDWEPLQKKVMGEKLTAFSYDRRNSVLYAGAIAGRGIFKSMDQGKRWELIPTPQMQWVHRIVLDPIDQGIIYIGTRARGIFKTTDGGKTWREINQGLTHNVIKALAIDPKNSLKLYAGAPNMIAVSRDGGRDWSPVEIKLPSYQRVIDSLTAISKAKSGTPSPPAPWKEKCNECHGWTDPLLNEYPTSYWRVAPTRRDWKETMDRMAQKGRNPMTPAEKAVIYGYLNNHFGPVP